ncbi:MAG: hypothetical protein JRI25_27225, partial [Deltaproteobacteria bacterium]|nr:hypothetical protein [Deltaproteobacteria bacterium]
MLMLLALLTSAWAGPCEGAPSNAQQVEAHVDDALFAFATLDETGVQSAAEAADAALSCLDEVLTPRRAAAYHRMVGVTAFMSGESEDALAAFRAARALEPDYKLSTRIAPEGGRLYRLYEQAAEPSDTAKTSFSPPRGVSAYVDGSPSDQLPGDKPTVVQYLRGEDVVWTGYIEPGAPPPATIESVESAPSVAEALEDLDIEDLDEAPVIDEAPEVEEPPISDDLASLADALGEGDPVEEAPVEDERRKDRRKKDRPTREERRADRAIPTDVVLEPPAPKASNPKRKKLPDRGEVPHHQRRLLHLDRPCHRHRRPRWRRLRRQVRLGTAADSHVLVAAHYVRPPFSHGHPPDVHRHPIGE